MLRISPRFLGAGLSLWLACAGGAAEFRLPPITGELAGVLSRYVLPGAPALRWRIAATPAGDGRRDYALTLEGDGALLRVSARLAENGDGTWRIEESRTALGPWLAALAPRFAPSLAGATAAGTVVLTGGGTLRRGQPEGKIKIELKDGALRHADEGWALEGVALVGEFSFDADGPHWTSTSPLELTVATISTTRFGARNLSLSATVDDKLVVSLRAARIEIAGGVVVIDPSTIPLSPPVVSVNLHINRVGMQDIVAIVPAGLADARGRINGELALRWSEATGVELGRGWLKLDDSEAANVTLSPQPGLITNQLQWWNPARLWGPAFRTLRRIEMGETPLGVSSMSAEINPDGDADQRTARIRVSAVSRGEGIRVPLEIDVSVAGLLNQLLKLGLDKRVQLGGK